MKHPAFLLSIQLLYLSSYCQNPTPNSSFENWTQVSNYFVPDGWDNLNASTSILGQLTCVQSSDAHSGNYACKLITKDVVIAIANGIITTGHLVTVPPYGVNGGIPYNLRPDSIAGWYKYEPQGNDSTEIEFLLFNSPSDSVGKALVKIGQPANVYTRFTMPIEYYNSDIPDSSRWLISASNGYNAVDETTLYIDDIEIIFNTGIQELNQSLITIGPNPVSHILHIASGDPLEKNFLLMDITGRIVQCISMHSRDEYLDIENLFPGIFTYCFTNDSGITLQTGKVAFAK